MPAQVTLTQPILHRQNGISTTNSLLIGGMHPGTIGFANLYRINLDTGNVDPEFTPGITQIISTYGGAVTSINSFVTNGVSRIVVGGTFNTYNSTLTSSKIVLLNTNGVLSTAYNFPAITYPNADNGVDAINFDTQGNIFFAGGFNFGSAHMAKIITASNILSPVFVVNTGASGYISTILRHPGSGSTPDGFIITGYFTSVQSVAKNSIARILEDGTLDPCFNPNPGVGSSGSATAFITESVLDSSGDIYMVGGFTTYDGIPRPNIAKARGNGVNNILVATADEAIVYSSPAIVTGIENILTNDTVNGNGVLVSTIPVSWSVLNSNPYLNLTKVGRYPGRVTVAPNTPPGIYTLTYQICTPGACGGTNCVSTTVTITVLGQLQAVDDDFSGTCVNGLSGSRIGNVLTNDTISGQSVSSSSVTVTLIDNGGVAGATINSLGNLSIPAGTLAGTYTLIYQICQTGTTNCDEAEIEICVNNGLNLEGSGPNNVIYDIKVQSDGKILIGGLFTTYNGITRNHIARLNSNLTLDTSFDPNGIGFNGTVYSIAIQGDKILVGGTFTAYGTTATGTPKHNLARLNSNGSIDNTFTNHAFNDANGTSVRIVKLTPDNNGIIVGGHFSAVDAPQSTPGTACIIKLTANGNIDTSFISPYATPTGGSINDIYIYPNQDMLIGSSYGLVTPTSGAYRYLRKMNAYGTLYSNFTDGSSLYGSWVNSITVNTTGKIIIGGFLIDYANSGRNHLLELNSDGTVDYNALMNQGAGLAANITNTVESVAFDSNNRLLIGGTFSQYGANNIKCIARLNINGTFDATFNTGNMFNSTIHKITLTQQFNQDRILVGGHFSFSNGSQANFITRLIPTTNPVIQGRVMAPQEGAISQKVVIYPNPSEGIFNIDLSGYDDVNFDMIVHNTLGQVMYKGSISSQNTNQVDLTRFQAGNYFITLQNSYETINKVVTVK